MSPNVSDDTGGGSGGCTDASPELGESEGGTEAVEDGRMASRLTGFPD